ncbi:MAG: ribonuclease P protein component [Ulvibacter sp.]|jgi:ribonuclease P protein component
MALGFPKSENLKSRTTIKQLFDQGRSCTSFPVKLLYIPQSNLKTTQAAFAVPKRNFKLAVSRNRIKRQMREAYRLHKQLLTTNSNTDFSLLFLYLGKDKPKYDKLEKAFKVLFKKLVDENS